MFTAKPEDGASEQNRLDVLYNQKLNNVVRGVDTYWLSKPLRTVFNHKHSLYLDGGTDDLRWGADFSYNSGEGVLIATVWLVAYLCLIALELFR